MSNDDYQHKRFNIEPWPFSTFGQRVVNGRVQRGRALNLMQTFSRACVVSACRTRVRLADVKILIRAMRKGARSDASGSRPASTIYTDMENESVRAQSRGVRSNQCPRQEP
jgi:hypothetical protein